VGRLAVGMRANYCALEVRGGDPLREVLEGDAAVVDVGWVKGQAAAP
jgi:hypothetical protein